MSMGDDAYPNQGDNIATSNDYSPWAPKAPEAQTEREQQEMIKIASSSGVVGDVVTWLQQCITFYGDLDSIDISGLSGDDIRVAINVAKNMQSEFRAKSKEFEELYRKVLAAKEIAESSEV